MVLSGRVAVTGSGHVKPGIMVRDDVTLDVAPAPPYVSRGGMKLERALERFAISPLGRVCADIGASTGGFTDCLLQHGAARVYAIDVGYGQLDWRLRTDPRVVALERTNARYLDRLPEPASLVVIDASFISLRLLIPAAVRIASVSAEVVALVKPQFEAGKGRVGKGGVVRDPAVHRGVLMAFARWLGEAGYTLAGVTASPIRGAAGNLEFFAHVRAGGSASGVGPPTNPGAKPLDLGCIEDALAEARALLQRGGLQAVAPHAGASP